MMAAKKRARAGAARGLAMATRVAGDKQGNSKSGKSDDNGDKEGNGDGGRSDGDGNE
jgi:hypothetical protein